MATDQEPTATGGDRPVTLHAQFTTTPEHAEEVGRLLAAYGDVVRAEPGNRTFAAYTLADDPTRFFVFEVYADQAAFEAHLRGEQGRVFNDALVPLILEPASVLTFLTPVGG